MKIGLKNFRIFKDRTDFEIRPITVLTGPNNAGKSALAKFFMLLQNGQENLDFSRGNHNMITFQKAVNFTSDKPFFSVYLNEIIPLFREVEIGIGYIESKPGLFKLSVLGTDLLTVSYNSYNLLNIEINYQAMIDAFLSREIFVPISFDSNGKAVDFVELHRSNINFLDYPEIDFHNYKKISCPTYDNVVPKIMPVVKVEAWSPDLWENHHYEELLSGNAIYNETEKLILEDTPYALFDVYKNEVRCTESYYSEILFLQGDMLTTDNLDDLLTSDLADIISGILKALQYTIQKSIQEKHADLDLVLKPSRSFLLLFTEKFLYWIKGPSQEEDGFSLIRALTRPLELLKENVSNAKFVTIDRGLQFKSMDNPNYKLLLNYNNYKGEKKGIFLKQALKMLGFPAEVIIKQVNLLNGIGIADLLLETEKGSQPLQDLGYGFSMLLPILIQIELGGSPIFIEEPEANLHPNYQSLLADIFVLATEIYPNVKIILETHSEYLIRKLQLLTAQKKIETDKSIIYYFNSDNNVTVDNPKVVEIEINQNGRLTEDFGPGFYDEAVTLQFTLSNINREQMN